MAAGAVGRAQAALRVLGIEAHVHARLVVGGRDQVLEDLERLAFEVGAEGLVAPGVAHLRLRAGAVALRQHGAGERKPAFGGGRRLLGEEGAHGRGVGLLLPQHRLGAAAQEADARPARIGGDEGGVAGEIDAVVVAAQDRPLDQLARDRIADGGLHLGGPGRIALARERDRLLDRGDIGGGGRRRGSGGGERGGWRGRGPGWIGGTWIAVPWSAGAWWCNRCQTRGAGSCGARSRQRDLRGRRRVSLRTKPGEARDRERGQKSGMGLIQWVSSPPQRQRDQGRATQPLFSIDKIDEALTPAQGMTISCNRGKNGAGWNSGLWAIEGLGL